MSLVYLSGGIAGLNYDDAIKWRKYASSKLFDLSYGSIRSITPMRSKEFLANAVINTFNNHQLVTRNECIYTRDRNDVKRCDLILVNLLKATKVSIGTVMEIAWADSWNKPIILAMEDDNIHSHPILNCASRIIVSDLDDAITLTYQMLTNE